MNIRRIVVAGLLGAALALGGLAGVRARQASCAYLPLIGENLLPNAGLAPGDAPKMAQGWSGAAAGVELGGPASAGFDYNGDGRALQLIGIANYIQSPSVPVRPGASYCFVGRALSDSDKGSATRLQVTFDWQDAQGRTLAQNTSDWQPVVLWQAEAPPDDWAPIRAAFAAPDGAAMLRLRLQPSSDDRVYLDAMNVRRTVDSQGPTADEPPATGQPSVVVRPWPNGAQAALSFSFDWETAMGGLIHSRSVDDPYADADPLLRAMRMRDGVTTTLELFRPHGIRATYYANGYNFLDGNPQRRLFMGHPTYSWATAANGWNDVWADQPWFSPDPYGTLQRHPEWYFADLVELLLAEQHDIQSHTFSHFHGGFVRAEDWQADMDAWRELAGPLGVAPAASLAFPWSSSAGMSDASWDALAAAGITSVTRTNWSQQQFALVDRAAPRCAPVPGHQQILACPDFYLIGGRAVDPNSQIAQRRAGGGPDAAIAQIDRAIAAGGMIDIWAHTEEVTSPAQIAAWSTVVDAAAQRRDAGTLWIAPLAEIAAWQHMVREVKIEHAQFLLANAEEALTFTVTNEGQQDLNGVTLQLPFRTERVQIERSDHPILNSEFLMLNLAAGQSVEVTAWPA